MSNKLIIAATLALNSLLIPYAMAADASPSTPSSKNNSNTESSSSSTGGNTSSENEMSKDAWLKAMEPMLPGLICKGFMNDTELKKRFDDLKITYDQCVAMIPDSEKKCQNQIYSSIPEKINNDSAGVWGKTLGECIGKDFAEKHLVHQS